MSARNVRSHRVIVQLTIRRVTFPCKKRHRQWGTREYDDRICSKYCTFCQRIMNGEFWTIHSHNEGAYSQSPVYDRPTSTLTEYSHELTKGVFDNDLFG